MNASEFPQEAEQKRSGDFLQSDLWRLFQENFGRESASLSGDGFSGMGFVESVPLFGTCIYFPHGPVFEKGFQGTDFSQRFLTFAKSKKAFFVRVEPQSEEEKQFLQQQFGANFVKAPKAIQPEETFVIDITPSEEDLLARMKSKTRYNIRLAEKRGVRIFETREKKYREAFLDLMEKTAKRKEIRPHARAYYKAFFTGFPEGVCRLFVAELDGEILAANLVLFFGDTVTYLHGGSSDTRRDAMAPYLLQWEQIKVAKNAGAVRYDFGGVKTVTRKAHGKNWDGITRFKQGFSQDTEPTLFPGTYDIILHAPKYFLYRVSRNIKNILRSI
ncbi:MAG: peptidoglycan bridge formation glycyltransferase FemA/FemB family protein [Patescibacteria group bacterium]